MVSVLCEGAVAPLAFREVEGVFVLLLVGDVELFGVLRMGEDRGVHEALFKLHVGFRGAWSFVRFFLHTRLF